jgi:hypothetical protein
MAKYKFTKHARYKFDILKRHGFPLSKKQVFETIANPDRLERSIKNRTIYQKSIDGNHVLRVVTEKRNKAIVIVTFYPGRREQYESEL